MIAATSLRGVDPLNGVALRTYYEALRSWFSTERSSWDTQWSQCSQFVLPRQQRFNFSQVDTGFRQDFAIVDNTATIGVNVLAAGIFSSVSNPTDRWYRMQLGGQDAGLMDNPEVSDWMDDTQDTFDDILLRSNYYSTLLLGYRNQVIFGTDAYAITEDPHDVIRCHPFPPGAYYLSGDDTLRIDCVMRIVNKTTRQLVDQFGLTNCSDQVQTLYQSNAGGQKEHWWPVVHVVHKNSYYDVTRPMLDEKPWTSIYYEMSAWSADQGILSRRGFEEMPIIASRWEVVGENFYGEAPVFNCIGDIRALQNLQKRKAQGIDKQVNPPMVGNPALENMKLSVLPGSVTFAEMRDGNPGFKPAYQVDIRLEGIIADITDHRQRINSALYKDLFLMNAESDRRQVTAEEIRARQQEKMLVLGPVALRNDNENLMPGLTRAFNICMRAGKFKRPPAVLRGKHFTFVFESILARAQKIGRTANIDRLMAFLGSQVAVNQGVLDNFDLDTISRDYARDLGIDQRDERTPEQVAKIRSDRQAQQQQAQQADNAQKLAQAGQTLSQTDVGSDSALTRLMPQLAQPAGAGGS